MSIHDFCRDHIDGVLITGGLLLGCALPLLLVRQAIAIDDRLPVFVGIPFFVLGLAALTVGVRGAVLNTYNTIDERRSSLFVTFLVYVGVGFALVLCLLVIGAISDNHQSYLARMAPSAAGRADPIRCASACLGGLGGFYLATLRPPVDQAKAFWLSIFGAGFGWFVAYFVMAIMIAGVLAWFGIRALLPHLPELSNRMLDARRLRQPPTNPDVKQIADLKQQIEWTRNCGAEARYRNEEVARLQQQLRDLGGIP